MEPTDTPPEAAERRDVVHRPHQTASRVERVVRDGEAVYVKTLLATPDAGLSAEHARQKLQREARIVALLAQHPRPHPRLGLVELMEVDLENLRTVTREVPGEPLEQALRRRRRDPSILMALYLAGRWQRWLQQLPVYAQDVADRPDSDPLDLVEYCQIRFRKAQEWGYGWPDSRTLQRLLDRLDQLVAQADRKYFRPVWSHADYSPGNLMWDGRILTPIDFTMAHVAPALTDVTHLIHRLEMFAIYFPWGRWPLSKWRAAVLRGYGDPGLVHDPAYRAYMVRHHICRLLTYIRRTPRSALDACHMAYIRARVRRRICQLLDLRSS